MHLFIDIHTHRHDATTGVLAIQNCISGFEKLPDTGWYSVGLHPWHLNADTAFADFNKMTEVTERKNVLAIGECGLDKASSTEWELQEYWFQRQMELAESKNKPLIIHCVRAFGEVLASLKKANCRVPVVFHGFNKGPEIAGQILNQGHYLSYGKNLLGSEKTQDAFLQTPFDRIFLETDDSGMSIESIYAAAATLKQVELKLLCKTIQRNAELAFGPQFLTGS